METFQHVKPHTVQAALRVLATEPGAVVVAGGTDLVTLMRDGIARPSHLVDVNGLPLDRLEWQPDGGVHIGALCRNAVDDARLRQQYPVLVEALRSGASPQIRNAATFGGNLLQRVRCPYYRMPEFACNRRDPGSGCASLAGDSHRQAVFGTSTACIAVHPSDCAVALLALDATVVVQSQRGTHRIPIGEFHRLPGDAPQREHVLRRDELIVAIDVPATPFAKHSHYLKFRDRASFAFALASAAVAVELRRGLVWSSRIALGGVAAKPWRSYPAEAELLGRRFTVTAINDAAEAAAQGAHPQEDNGYKVELVRRVVRQALTELGDA